MTEIANGKTLIELRLYNAYGIFMKAHKPDMYFICNLHIEYIWPFLGLHISFFGLVYFFFFLEPNTLES